MTPRRERHPAGDDAAPEMTAQETTTPRRPSGRRGVVISGARRPVAAGLTAAYRVAVDQAAAVAVRENSLGPVITR